ncbi:MAG: DUF2325 domain-containing protein [Acetobacteraceae bacterium]
MRRCPPAGPPRRAKIWEFNTNLHCSIIGTCLSTAELRQLLRKLGLALPDSTDHDLHGAAVSLAGRHDKAAKLLNKALDERHRLAIGQFAKAATEAEVRALWRDALRRGEIPGAYWAALTHPATSHAIIRDAFGEVHMLSHLVGAANRADIRRLCQLEEENAALQARLDRQQAAFREAVVTRDACIQELRQALARRLAAEPPVSGGNSGGDHAGGAAAGGATGGGAAAGANPGGDTAMLRQLTAELERRLGVETRRGAVLGERLTSARAAVTQERSARADAEREAGALRRELDVVEASLLAISADRTAMILPEPSLDGVTLLYVGGRPHQLAHLRAIAERLGAVFLHHDGGVEHHLNLLAGLTSQATLVVFPVDCISHHAALAAKMLCRQAGKRFIPLRSASATSLLAALRRPEVAGLADAAD